MRKIRHLLILALIPLLLLSGCVDDYLPGSVLQPCSLDSDGSNFVLGDTRLYNSSRGTAYYLSDELVFYAGRQILRAPLGAATTVAVTPAEQQLSQDGIIAIDQPLQRLYYAWNGDIYVCGFSGENRINLSTDTDRALSLPTLSEDRDHLVAISGGKINRLEIASGNWTHLDQPVNALYAVYVSAEDRYYYFGSNGNTKSFYGLDPSAGTPELLMTNSAWAFELSYSVSPDLRFFGLLKREHSWQVEYDDILRVYDRREKDIIEIPACNAYAFSPVDGRMLYSQGNWGLADLHLRDLDTEEDTLLLDGIYSSTTYSCIMYRIDWRADAGKIFYNGEMGFRHDRRKHGPETIAGSAIGNRGQ